MVAQTTVSSMQALAAWISENAVPEYFASVTFDNGVITCKDAENHPLMEYDSDNGSFSIYKTTGGSAEMFTTDTRVVPSAGSPAVAAKCGGGLMVLVNVSVSSSGSGWYCLNFIITKNNHDVTAVIAGYYYNPNDAGKEAGKQAANSTASRSGIHAVALGDDTSAAKTFTFTAHTRYQTQLVPFTTYAKPDEKSYTPTAFYLPCGQYYSIGFGKFQEGEKLYITNGYWAIEDAAEVTA